MKKKLFISIIGGLAILFGMFAFVPKNVESIRAAEGSTTYSQGDVVAKDKTRLWIGYDMSNPFYQYSTDLELSIYQINENKLYCAPSSNWKEANAKILAYFWNPAKVVDMTDADGDGIYECDIPSGAKNVIFVRDNPSNTTFDFNKVWAKSPDINNFTKGVIYYNSGWGTSFKKTTSKFGTFVETYKLSNSDVAGTFYNNSEEGDKSTVPNFDQRDNNANNGKARRYDYFDIKTSHYTNSSGCIIALKKFENGNFKGTAASTSALKLNKDNASKVLYVGNEWSWDNVKTDIISAGVIDKVDAGLAAKALAGIHSCSDSNINGYNSFPNFRDTFVLKSNSEWKTDGYLGDYTLNDFANGDVSLSGSTTNVVNAYDKYVFIENKYNSNQPNAIRGISIDENNTALIAISVLCVISTLGFFVFIRRKKINLN